jgi:hypothetical protein
VLNADLAALLANHRDRDSTTLSVGLARLLDTADSRAALSAASKT